MQDQEQNKAGGDINGTFVVEANPNAAGFPNMMNMNMNMGFNNTMDYTQMMQFMSTNGMSMGNMNNMMGSFLSDSAHVT